MNDVLKIIVCLAAFFFIGIPILKFGSSILAGSVFTFFLAVRTICRNLFSTSMIWPLMVLAYIGVSIYHNENAFDYFRDFLIYAISGIFFFMFVVKYQLQSTKEEINEKIADYKSKVKVELENLGWSENIEECLLQYIKDKQNGFDEELSTEVTHQELHVYQILKGHYSTIYRIIQTEFESRSLFLNCCVNQKYHDHLWLAYGAEDLKLQYISEDDNIVASAVRGDLFSIKVVDNFFSGYLITYLFQWPVYVFNALVGKWIVIVKNFVKEIVNKSFKDLLKI